LEADTLVGGLQAAQPAAGGEEAGARDRLCPRSTETDPALSGVDQADPIDPGLTPIRPRRSYGERRTRSPPALWQAELRRHRQPIERIIAQTETSRSSWRGGRRQRKDRQPVRAARPASSSRAAAPFNTVTKLNLTTGRSGLILDPRIKSGGRRSGGQRPVLAHAQTPYRLLRARRPDRTAADGGFASRDNLSEAKVLGVRDAAFHKKAGLRVMDMGQEQLGLIASRATSAPA
jgi:hypothetical protein